VCRQRWGQVGYKEQDGSADVGVEIPASAKVVESVWIKIENEKRRSADAVGKLVEGLAVEIMGGDDLDPRVPAEPAA
jgi:hypothetical protein